MPDEAKKVHFFFIGSIGVGKTAIIHQILKGTFVTEYPPTQFTSLASETSISGHRVTFRDTRGSDTVDCLRLSVPSERCALVFVYDVTERESLDNVEKTISEFQEYGFTNPVILLGNKTDKQGECNVRRESVEQHHPQAFVDEVSATTRTKATSPFVSLLNNIDFMQRLEAYSSEPDRAQILRTDALPKRRARAGCTSISWLWLQRLFYELLVDDIRSSEPTSSTIERPEHHFVAQASDFSTVTVERETIDPPPPRASSVLRPTTPARRPPSDPLPPLPPRKAEQQVREVTECTSAVRIVLLVEGRTLPRLLKPMSTPRGLYISKFAYKKTVYLWVRAPTDLMELIKMVRKNLPWCRPSTLGICTIGEFWYAITTSDRYHSYASTVREPATLAFKSSLRKYEDTACAHFARQSLLQGNPSERVRRDIWSIFVLNRGQLVTHIASGTAARRQLLDVSLHDDGVELSFPDVLTKLVWSNCIDLYAVGIHFDPTIQRMISNLMG